MSEVIKPRGIVYESTADAESRRRRSLETDRRALGIDATEAPFRSATSMLSWFFSVKDNVGSIAAIDPSADVVQGLRGDKLERAWKVQSVRQALEELQRQQGNSTGALLLWLHLRPRVPIGRKRVRGVEVVQWGEPVPLWELFRDPAVNLSQRAATRLYWESLEVVEDFGLNRRWILERAERRSKASQVYQRGQP